MVRRSQPAPVFSILLSAFLFSKVEAAYFNVHQGEEKCFEQISPQHQVATVKYEHIDNPGVECMLIFKDPKGKQAFSKRVGPEDTTGEAVYMSQSEGSHRICIQCKGASRWFQQTALKWSLHVDVGDTELVKQRARFGQMKGVSRSVLEALARIEAVSAENEYERITETEFRDSSEGVNSHVVWVGVFIMVLEGALVLWQISNLRGFFRREKLI
eukprot:TRINITY_DN53357_c0_g1_i1.p1 TRINITY_DN53357_c0_g1~~TRINITY_DN53357_c0_g1_i1.p1  ORF type:complete len:214 (+),score=29.05 TRINITY_DN53357_c0_g1_i1:116-757(+)